jgi:bifunctional DNA-binding transcriptional regulator/antitoxin component of YhaV-PrlF toxin-antitoxin module
MRVDKSNVTAYNHYMTYTVSITSQGQISIPIKLRRELFSDTNKAIVSVQDGKVMLEPVKDLLSLAGSLKTTKKPLSNEELHELFALSVAETYAKQQK